uniref:Uncharacterized protein n=1 Tax=Panagrolaimus sp. ES5 TaxID=591445 RepID=A0AC34FJ67_9BILA
MSEAVPKINNNEVLQRFCSTLERIVLFFAFDFTLDWKQTLNYFNGKRRQNNNYNRQSIKADDYSKVLRKKCLHKPTVPPRSSPRKHVRGKIQSYDEPKVEARKKSSVEMNVQVSSSSKKSGGNKKNADKKITSSNLEATKVSKPQPFTPLENVTEEIGTLSLEENVCVGEESISNPFAILLQPIINLWSNNANDEGEKVFDDSNNIVENDQSTVTFENSNANEIQKNDQHELYQENPQQDIPTMDMLEEALNESPEKFIDTLIAMNNAATFVASGASGADSGITNESYGQQLLAEAGNNLEATTKISKPQPFTPLENVTEEIGTLCLEENVNDKNVEEESISNPFTLLLQPIINLWSNNANDEGEKFFDDSNNIVENDQSTVISDNLNANEIPKNDQHELYQENPQQDIPTMDMLEEALNESPEKFIDTLIAMNNAASASVSSESVSTAGRDSVGKAGITNESYGQQLLAEAGKLIFDL